MPTGHISLFMMSDMLTRLVTYLFCLITLTRPRSKSKFLLLIHLLHTTVIVVHALELLCWNRCQFPSIFIWLMLLHALQLVALFLIKSGHNMRKKVCTSKVLGVSSTIIMKTFEFRCQRVKAMFVLPKSLPTRHTLISTTMVLIVERLNSDTQQH